MTYEVGQRIDLTYINRKSADLKKNSWPENSQTLYQVGTQFIFNLTPQGLKAAIRIPVAVA